jgi:hypothetical protein
MAGRASMNLGAAAPVADYYEASLGVARPAPARSEEDTRKVKMKMRIITDSLNNLDRTIATCDALFEKQKVSIRDFKDARDNLKTSKRSAESAYRNMKFSELPFATDVEKENMQTQFDQKCTNSASFTDMLARLEEKIAELLKSR